MCIFWFNSPTTRKPVSDLMVEAAKAVVADKIQDQDSANPPDSFSIFGAEFGSFGHSQTT